MRHGFRYFFKRAWGAAQKRRRSEPGSEKFAPHNGKIRASEEWGANQGPEGRRRAGKSLLPGTEEQGLAGRGEQTQGPGASTGQEKVCSPRRRKKG